MRWSRLSEPAGFAARWLAGNVETDPRRVVARRIRRPYDG